MLVPAEAQRGDERCVDESIEKQFANMKSAGIEPMQPRWAVMHRVELPRWSPLVRQSVMQGVWEVISQHGQRHTESGREASELGIKADSPGDRCPDGLGQ